MFQYWATYRLSFKPFSLLWNIAVSLSKSLSCAVTNGNHHSPPTLNAVPSPPQRYSNGPSSSSSSSLANQQLPATCGARQLSKLKRFLTTLQQFGNDISPEIGDSVRSLVLALVVSRRSKYDPVILFAFMTLMNIFLLSLSKNSTVTIEEFHSRLQEATNFPLRPFVIPFLKVDTCFLYLFNLMSLTSFPYTFTTFYLHYFNLHSICSFVYSAAFQNIVPVT